MSTGDDAESGEPIVNDAARNDAPAMSDDDRATAERRRESEEKLERHQQEARDKSGHS